MMVAECHKYNSVQETIQTNEGRGTYFPKGVERSPEESKPIQDEEVLHSSMRVLRSRMS